MTRHVFRGREWMSVASDRILTWRCLTREQRQNKIPKCTHAFTTHDHNAPSPVTSKGKQASSTERNFANSLVRGITASHLRAFRVRADGGGASLVYWTRTRSANRTPILKTFMWLPKPIDNTECLILLVAYSTGFADRWRSVDSLRGMQTVEICRIILAWPQPISYFGGNVRVELGRILRFSSSSDASSRQDAFK